MAKRRNVAVFIDGQLFGVFDDFKKSYDTLKDESFELKTYRNEIMKFGRFERLKLIACKRGDYYYTVLFCKHQKNKTLFDLRPLHLN